MYKGIIGADVRVGDTIRINDGTAVTVLRFERHCDIPSIRWLHGGECLILLGDNSRVELVHRPYPEGTTEANMLDAVIDRAGAVVHCVVPETIGKPRSVERRIAELREVLDAYELGKPEVKS